MTGHNVMKMSPKQMQMREREARAEKTDAGQSIKIDL